MASELNYDKLVKLVKGDKGITQGQAAQKLGLSIGQVPMLKFNGAQVAAGVYQKAPATGPSIKKLRDSEGNRWELIAARTGLGVAAVKAKYEEAGGDAKAYVGRGRDHSKATRSKPAGRRKPASTGKPSGRKPAARRKPAGTAANKGGKSPVVRRTTRRSTAGNPS